MSAGKSKRLSLFKSRVNDQQSADLYGHSSARNPKFSQNSIESKLREINRINSHQTRHSNAKILNVLEMLKKGQIETQDALTIISKMSENIENDTITINELLKETKREGAGSNVFVLDKPVSHIWMVDDDITVNYVHKRIMEKDLGLKVTTFSDPVKALRKLENNEDIPDLIFLDINMPVVDGFDFLERMLGSYPTMKVIVLSSSVAADDVSTALSFDHVISYYTKPLRPEMVEQLRFANSHSEV